MHVLAIGECMAELAPSETEGDFRLGFAGDTFNTAWYLAQCAPDVQVSYLSAIGDDATSQQMRAFMRDSGIDDRFVQTCAGKTIGLYLISLDNGERSFSYWRGQSAARSLADEPELLSSAMATADLIYFSGITLAILPKEKRAALLTALQSARDAGKTIAFDPNLRPRLWASSEEMTQEIMRAAATSDIALPSFEDEADWFKDADCQATIARYRQAGVGTVVVKNGEEAVVFAQGAIDGEVPVQAVKTIVDSTAAGDSFNAGFFAGHVDGRSLDQSIRDACAISRQVVQNRGALVRLKTMP